MAETLDIIQALMRGLALLGFIYLGIFFRKNYNIQKKKGFENKFFQGYAMLFWVMALAQFFMFLSDVFNLINIGILDPFQGDFPGHDTPEAREVLKFLWNLDRPLYILGFGIWNLVFAGHIYPLESTILQWKAKPLTRFNVLATILVLLIYIPPLQISVYAFYFLAISLLAIALGFLLNIGVNLWLAIKTPGAVRKRATYSLLGFLLLMVGFNWALKVGWSEAIYSGFNYTWDVIFGSIVELISIVFYKAAFPTEQLE